MAKTQDNVVKEFGNIGRYRVRLLGTQDGRNVLDIREWIANESFEGYTRRGIRLAIGQDTQQLAEVLTALHAPSQPVQAKPKKGVKK